MRRERGHSLRSEARYKAATTWTTATPELKRSQRRSWLGQIPFPLRSCRITRALLPLLAFASPPTPLPLSISVLTLDGILEAGAILEELLSGLFNDAEARVELVEGWVRGLLRHAHLAADEVGRAARVHWGVSVPLVD